MRQEETVSVSKVRSRFHLEEKQRSSRELRVRSRAKISVPVLRSPQQADVTGLRPHQEETSGRGSVYLRHEALNLTITTIRIDLDTLYSVDVTNGTRCFSIFSFPTISSSSARIRFEDFSLRSDVLLVTRTFKRKRYYLGTVCLYDFENICREKKITISFLINVSS